MGNGRLTSLAALLLTRQIKPVALRRVHFDRQLGARGIGR